MRGVLSVVAGLVLVAASSGCAGSPGGSTPTPADGTATPAPNSWSIVSSPLPAPSRVTILQSVTCVSASDCWAVGDYVGEVGGTGPGSQMLIEHTTGSGWTLVPRSQTLGGATGALNGVACTTADDCWVVGSSIGHYTGGGWSIDDSGPLADGGANAELNGVSCVESADCWAVGTYLPSRGPSETLVEHYQGSRWSTLASPNPSGNTGSGLDAVTCASSADCWAVGSYSDSTGISHPLIEQDTGSGWAIAPSPSPPGSDPADRFASLGSVACAGPDDCWAFGTYTEFGLVLIEHDTGSGWTILPAPWSPDDEAFSSGGVTCLSADDCWADGYYDYEPDQAQPWIASFQGGGWTFVSTPTPAGSQTSELNAVACTGADDCWAVGSVGAPDVAPGPALIEQRR